MTVLVSASLPAVVVTEVAVPAYITTVSTCAVTGISAGIGGGGTALVSTSVGGSLTGMIAGFSMGSAAGGVVAAGTTVAAGATGTAGVTVVAGTAGASLVTGATVGTAALAAVGAVGAIVATGGLIVLAGWGIGALGDELSKPEIYSYGKLSIDLIPNDSIELLGNSTHQLIEGDGYPV